MTESSLATKERVSLQDLLEAIGTSIRTNPEDPKWSEEYTIYQPDYDAYGNRVRGMRQVQRTRMKPCYEKVLWLTSSNREVFTSRLVFNVMDSLSRSECFIFKTCLPMTTVNKFRIFEWIDDNKKDTYDDWSTRGSERVLSAITKSQYERKKAIYEQKAAFKKNFIYDFLK